LATRLRPSNIPPDTILFREGDYGDRFYIVLEGQIDIIKSMGGSDESLLRVLGAGDFVGEMSLLHPDGLRAASVRARTLVRLLEMTRGDFNALLKRQPVLAYEMMRIISRRLGESENSAIRALQEKNRLLREAYHELQAVQAQIIEKEKLDYELRLARD